MIRFLLPLSLALLLGAPVALAQVSGPLVDAYPPSVEALSSSGSMDWGVTPSARGGDACEGGEMVGNEQLTHFFRLTPEANVAGQSFIAACTGAIDQIDIAVYAHTDGTASPLAEGEFHIYEGEGGAGDLLYMQEYEIVAPAPGTFQTHSFQLTEIVEVMAGEVYSYVLVQVDGQLQVLAINDDVYEDGSLLFTNTGDPVNLEPYVGGGGEPFDKVFTVHFAEFDVSSEDAGVAQQLQLGAAYPNPAAGRVVIPFELDMAQQVQIALYDLLGRQIMKAADEFFSAGPQEISVDVEGLPSGLYFYRATVDGNALTRRLMVIQ